MLTKEQKIQAILMIKQGLITPAEVKGHDSLGFINGILNLTAVISSGFSKKKMLDNDLQELDSILYNKYQDKAGRIYNLEYLPPLIWILSVWHAWPEEENGKNVIKELSFHKLGRDQRIHIALFKNQINGTI